MDCEDAMISNPYLNQNKFPPKSTRLGGFLFIVRICLVRFPCSSAMLLRPRSIVRMLQRHCKNALETMLPLHLGNSSFCG